MAVLGSGVILFGGWFVYHSYAMENPLTKVASGVAGVHDVSTNLTGSQAVFHVTLDDGVNLRDLYDKIAKDGSDIIGKREIVLDVTSNSSPQLEDWWAGALFDVAQAMETRHYADIPATLTAKASTTGLQVSTEMDDANVYVRLSDGTHSKYEILPRVPATMGAWSN
jgi:hypothetical protein